MSKQKYPQSATVSSTGTSVSKGRETYSSVKLHAKRDRKRREADDRQFEYDKKTTAQKLKELGETGSNRQRVRFTALLAKEQEEAKAKKQAKAVKA